MSTRSSSQVVVQNHSLTYLNVHIGEGSVVGPFCEIGVPPRGAGDGELETRIGGRSVIRSHTVIYAGNVIGDGFQTGHGVLIRESNAFGDHVSVGSHTVVEHHVQVNRPGRELVLAAFPAKCTLNWQQQVPSDSSRFQARADQPDTVNIHRLIGSSDRCRPIESRRAPHFGLRDQHR